MEWQLQANDTSTQDGRAPGHSETGAPVDGGAHSLLGAALHGCAGYVFGEKSKVTEAITNYGPETLYASALLFPGGKAVVASAAIGALNEVRTDDSLKEGAYDAVLGSVKGGATKFAFDKISRVEFTKSILNAPVKGVVMGSTSTLLDSGLSRRTYDLDGKFDFGTGIDRTIQSVSSPRTMAVNAATFGFAGGASAVLNKLSGGFIARSPGVATLLTGSTFGIASGGITEASRQAAAGHGFDIGKIASESAIHGALYGLAAVPAGLKVGFVPGTEAKSDHRTEPGIADPGIAKPGIAKRGIAEPGEPDIAYPGIAKSGKLPAGDEPARDKPLTGDEPAQGKLPSGDESSEKSSETKPVSETSQQRESLRVFADLSSAKEAEPTGIVATDRFGQTTRLERITEDGAAMPEWRITAPDGKKFSVHADVRIDSENSMTVSGHSVDLSANSLDEIVSTFFIKPDITRGANAQLAELKEILAPLSAKDASMEARNNALSDLHYFVKNHRSPSFTNAIRDEMPFLPAESRNALTRYFDDPLRDRVRHSSFLRETAFQMMREGKIEPTVISDITRLSEIVEKSPRLNDEQKAQTVKNVLELLDDGNDPSMDAAARIEMPKGLYRTAAIQSAMHVANPDTINQYAHPTCALASLEVATYTRAPDVATGLVSEVLRTGKFVTTDGTVIKLDPMSLRPEHGSEFIDDVALNQHASPTQYRSYASQIFQTTAANIHWQTQTVNPDGQSVPRGTLRYELRYAPNAPEDSPPTGYVVDYSREKPKYWEAPGYTEAQMQNINELISDRLNYEFIPQNAVTSEQQLKRFLAAMPLDRMPITAAVDARYLDPDLAGEPNILAHDIIVHASFDPTGLTSKDNWLVRMKNPWTGRSEYITISKLYEMTYERPDFTGPSGQISQKMVPVSREDFARIRQKIAGHLPN